MRRSDLQIAKPCHENWAAMTPNEKGRHCASCNKTVVDLTAMPTEAATKFIVDLSAHMRSKTSQRVCVHARTDAKGYLLMPRKSGVRRLLLTNGLAAILAVSTAGCQGPGPQAGNSVPSTNAGALTDDSHCAMPLMGSVIEDRPFRGEVIAPGEVQLIEGDLDVGPEPEPQITPEPFLLGRIQLEPEEMPEPTGNT